MEYAQTTTQEIHKAIMAMQESLVGFDDSTIQMACLAVAILMHKPTIDITTLIETVKGASEYIHLALIPTTGSIN